MFWSSYYGGSCLSSSDVSLCIQRYLLLCQRENWSVPPSSFPYECNCWCVLISVKKDHPEMIYTSCLRSGTSHLSRHNHHWVFLTQTHLWGQLLNSRFYCTFTLYVCICLINLLTINLKTMNNISFETVPYMVRSTWIYKLLYIQSPNCFKIKLI